MGVPYKASLAASFDYDRWCVGQLYSRSLHLFNGDVCMGRQLFQGV